MSGITKRFPGVLANDRVDFDVLAGEVHTLFGENGAGKTTLMRILYGLYRPDEGEIRFKGEAVAITSPADAIRLGIGMIHQHFTLVNTLDGRRERRARAEVLPRPAHRPQGRIGASRGTRRDVRAEGGAAGIRLAALGRRAPAGRDSEGPLPRRRFAHLGRADRRSHPERGRRPVPGSSPARRRRTRPRLHLAQSRRGARAVGPHHRSESGPACRHAAGARSVTATSSSK